MSGHNNLSGKQGIIALKMLEDVKDILDKNNIEFWVDSGTLLGIVREKRLLPWDNDVDLSVKAEYEGKLLFCLKEISALGYRVRKKIFDKDSKPFIKNRTRIIKIRNNRFFFFRGKVTLDIYIKYKYEGQYFYQCGERKKASGAVFFDLLDSIEFNAKTYKIPYKHEAYLTKKYGNWKVVNKTWNAFKDDSTIISDV